MSSLDELGEMLADRCEEFFVNDFGVNWRYYSDPHTATESMDGTLIVTGLTPEQAIAATLGPKVCHMSYNELSNTSICLACGWRMDGKPNYCPNCGAKVVEE